MDQWSDPMGIESLLSVTQQVWEYKADLEEVVDKIPSKNNEDNGVGHKNIRKPWSKSSPEQPVISKPLLRHDQ